MLSEWAGLGNWPTNETRSLAIADLIWCSAGESAGLHDVDFMGAENFSEIYITLHYNYMV